MNSLEDISQTTKTALQNLHIDLTRSPSPNLLHHSSHQATCQPPRLSSPLHLQTPQKEAICCHPPSSLPRIQKLSSSQWANTTPQTTDPQPARKSPPQYLPRMDQSLLLSLPQTSQSLPLLQTIDTEAAEQATRGSPRISRGRSNNTNVI
jgi:hypothetical protein